MSDPTDSPHTRNDPKGALDRLKEWINERTGLGSALRWCAERPVPGGVRWRNVLPSMIAFTVVVQAISGFVLWAFYSPSAQTAWESVYYLQYEVPGGWLLRGVHHYAAQVLVGLAGIYVVYLVLSGLYRSPRECVYWAAVLMGLLSLGSCLTGDLLAWDQNSFASTQVRVKFLMLLPGIGDDLFKLAAGGPAFGHLTLTRFFALHVGVFALGLVVLIVLHAWLLRRAVSIEGDQPAPPFPVCGWVSSLAARLASKTPSDEAGADKPGARYWPDQFLRNAAGWLVVMAVVLLLVGRHALFGDHAGRRPGDYLGVELGAPADPDPANFYAAARPEWSFRGLYQLSNIFPGDPIPGLGISWKLLPIFVIPGCLVLLVLCLPFIGRLKQGYWINVAVLGVLLVGAVALSAASWWHDFGSVEYREALAEGQAQAERAKLLARSPQGIPVSGALSLLRSDSKTQGPKICEKQCAVCHNYIPAEGEQIASETPSAPELYGFAGREWLAGFFNPDKIKGPEYYGNTRFAAGIMVRYVEGTFSKLEEEDQTAIIAALSAEARLPSQIQADAGDQDLVAKGKGLIVKHGCTRCHRYYDEGTLGNAPDLTGYGSRDWTMGIVINPTHHWFYGQRNDRMPAYLEHPEQPEKNRLAASDAALVVEWLRGEWYEPSEAGAAGGGNAAAGSTKVPPMLTVGIWAARRVEPQPVPETPEAQARALYVREHCAICHDCTGAPGGDILAQDPSAPDLGGYASRGWIAGLLDPDQIKTRKYFGNSDFRRGKMVAFVEGTLSDLDDEERKEIETLAAALSAEAQLPSQSEIDRRDADRIKEGRELLDIWGCTDCHRFHESKGSGAPDLTGYGSREWLAEIVGDPTQERFYGKRNAGMPSYRMFPDQPRKNLFSEEHIEQLADWLRRTPEDRAGQAEK